MPTWTKQEYEQWKLRSGNVENTGVGVSSGFQKQKAVHPRPQHRKTAHLDGPKNETMDGPGHPQFALTITFAFCDNRQRDLDGAATTVLDCLEDALRSIPGFPPVAPGDSHLLSGS